ncbi:hypothetical protein B0H17DRAFT_1139182 [Mycena rosella]|uniref:Uncharacterized protein n=1 Tax=Mycena rosella TaxID=1033263 RepID=A0AAD7D554_MYCRO|nr:hypothetical protein B0H17DRAFT_1139182 [Mycena rosella]
MFKKRSSTRPNFGANLSIMELQAILGVAIATQGHLSTAKDSRSILTRPDQFPLPSSSWLIRVVSDCGNFDRIRGVSAQLAREQHPIGEWPCFKDRDNDTTRPDLPPSRTILWANLFFSLLIAAPIVHGENHELRDGHEPTELLPRHREDFLIRKASLWFRCAALSTNASLHRPSLEDTKDENCIDKGGNNNTIHCGSGSQEVVAIINPGSLDYGTKIIPM